MSSKDDRTDEEVAKDICIKIAKCIEGAKNDPEALEIFKKDGRDFLERFLRNTSLVDLEWVLEYKSLFEK